jgi:Peptidase family M1 domain
VPKVTGQIRVFSLLAVMAVSCNLQIAAQPPQDTDVSNKAGPAEALYEQLRTVGLDRSRVYQIRDASLDRASLHISLNDGTIAFTGDVAGRVTGAFFAGDGEVLLSPPDQIERSSMALFTGAAILEEGFVTAYLRFDDDTFEQLEPFLRTTENSEAFIARWNDSARRLAEDDALRLLTSFSRMLPANNNPAAGQISKSALDPEDRLLHLKVEGHKLGIFDLFFDLAAKEQISAGQLRKVDGINTYDVWTSFAVRKQQHPGVAADIAGAEDDRGDIEVSNYKIDAEIKPPTQLDAEAQLKLVVHRGGDRAAVFELSRNLKIRAVRADGRRVEFIHNPALEGTQLERRGDDLVAVVFPEPLRTGQRIQLEFSYGGNVLSEAGGGLLYVGARGKWYPNRGFSKAMFDLEFRYPAGWTLLATGKKEAGAPVMRKMPHGAQSGANPGQVSHWVSERPIPVAGFNLGKYSHVTRQAGPVAVEVYAASAMERGFPQVVESEPLPQPPGFPLHRVGPTLIPPIPPSPAANAQSLGNDTARAIAFFAARFGPYPYDDLAVTQMPGSVSQGWPGLIFLSSFSFLSPNQKSALHMSPVERTISDGVIAHEAAHQWWGDLVTWDGYRDQWIMEGLANYSSLLLLESENPSRFRELMQSYRDDLLQKNKDGLPCMEAGPVTLGVRLNSSKFPGGYETIAYERGTWLFHMLRTMMRDGEQKSIAATRGGKNAPDEPFLRALRELSERYQTKPVTTSELIGIFEEQLPPSAWRESRKSLDWFYEGWVNGTAIPRLELHGLKYVDKNNSTIVSGFLKQEDAPDSLVTSVPVYALLRGKNVLLGRVFADGDETRLRLAAPLGTRKILIDPDHTVLSRSH